VICRFALALLVALAACKPALPPRPAQPALWEVTGKLGERAWLFGTIHALPYKVNWHSRAVDGALVAADELVLEIAAIDDQAGLEQAFARLAQTPGQPPLLDRVAPPQRAALAKLLADNKVDSAQFRNVETWAAALILAKQLAGEENAAYGIDREILAAAKGKKIGEFEGPARQLGIFDALPEAEQRDLLTATVVEAAAPATDDDRIVRAWRRGDMAAMASEARTGLLADPELREALLTGRNRDWAAQLEARLRKGGRPFVAVGAAHMAGPDGLPAMLAARGYTVRRVQ
jgi:uncharacterized protein